MKPKPKILLTGAPGIGKTTLILRVIKRLEEIQVKMTGFVSVEERGKKGRAGFVLRTLDGREVPFAVQGKGKGAQVGKYVVDVQAFEQLALEVISYHTDVDLYVIDEIGPMETLSKMFCETSRMLLKNDRVMLLGSVAKKSTSGFIRDIKRLPNIELIEITEDNHAQVEDDLLMKITAAFVASK